MIGRHAQRSFLPLTVIATLSAALILQACAGKALGDCGSGSSCVGVVGASGSTGEGGSGAIGGSDATGVAGTGAEPEACENGLRDGAETDVDCGGSNECARCALGTKCNVNEDCESELCSLKRCVAATCYDEIKNQDESDIDCGGSCAPCVQTPTCYDRIKNQDESDIDCGGGGLCAACPIGAHCNVPDDCASFICSTNTSKCSADTVQVTPTDVIDDFEDGDLLLPNPALGGRVGTWTAFGDGSGTGGLNTVAIRRGANSVKALHATGQDFTAWGSGFVVDLDNSGSSQSTKAPYDASVYTAITFWARAKSSMNLIVALPDVDTDLAGKLCTTCDHHYVKTVPITTNWQRTTISFSDLRAEPGTVPEPRGFKPSGLFSVQFRLLPGENYDLFVDDIAFIK